MDKIIWIALALLSGAFLPIQAGLNTKLGKALASPVYASMFSFIVGAAGLITYIILTRQTISWAGIKDAPGYVWIGGLLGAFYVTVIILAFPKLGPGLTFGLVVAGQMTVSILLEHFNILVAQQNSISFMKVLGVLLVVAGVIIIRQF
ncbi:DMT family transporter [Chryseolinea sp. H1M3-3]|uniref:DMT family transporter n=1 Tax=Chryseolinea sp. H1M3-3 TaxID=3034144 RepID=UPI0023EC9BFC|nr:DMT family transporter [Chryseolinea sp. H1M3-3]